MENEFEKALSHWFASQLGHCVLAAEYTEIEETLSHIYGFHIAQLGYLPQANFMDKSPINHQIIISESRAKNHPAICAQFDTLPLRSASVDAIVIPHVLEYADNPKAIIDEACRVLIPEGHIILLHFNPTSLWGLKKTLGKKDKFPWNGKFYSVSSIKHWIEENDCTVIAQKSLFFRPPLSHTTSLDNFKFMEILGKLCWPFSGGINIIVAKKIVMPLTPIAEVVKKKLRWRTAPEAAEPTS